MTEKFLAHWRTSDLVVAAVLAVASGVIFVAWNSLYAPASLVLGAVTPGGVSLLDGVWLIGGILVALVIRKPGAALFGETLASVVSAVIGNQWGFTVLLTGIIQGLAIEAGFAIARRAQRDWTPALFGGLMGGFVEGIIEVVFWYPANGAAFWAIYIAAATVSGAVLGAGLSVIFARALRRTGILASIGR